MAGSPIMHPGVIAERAQSLADPRRRPKIGQEELAWDLNRALCSASEVSLVLAIHEIVAIWAMDLKKDNGGG
jgi:hypothetical protein